MCRLAAIADPPDAAVILFLSKREKKKTPESHATKRVIYKFKANDDNLEATSLLVEGGDIFGFESLPRLANSRATIHWFRPATTTREMRRNQIKRKRGGTAPCREFGSYQQRLSVVYSGSRAVKPVGGGRSRWPRSIWRAQRHGGSPSTSKHRRGFSSSPKPSHVTRHKTVAYALPNAQNTLSAYSGRVSYSLHFTSDLLLSSFETFGEKR